MRQSDAGPKAGRDGRLDVAALRGRQSLGHFPLAQISHGREALKLSGPWTGLALLPVVDRLARHAHELAVVRCGQSELAPMRGQAARTEAPFGACLWRLIGGF